MNYIQMLNGMDMLSIGQEFAYEDISAVDALFVPQKTANLKAEVAKLTAGGTIPQMAQVHAFDTEARIGSRVGYESMKLEKLLIKEKMNLGEAARYFVEELGGSQDETSIKNFIFNDVNTLVKRVQTRATVMNGELLSTGKLTIKENNVDTIVDYGFSIDNTIYLNGWATAGTDVIGQLNTVIQTAKNKGAVIRRAITSSKQIGRLMKNTTILSFMKDIGMAPTMANLKAWLLMVFEIEFVAIDDVYKIDATSTDVNRVFDEDVVTFLSTTGTIGKGLWGVTPEEMVLPTMTSGYVTTVKYQTEDPVGTWTKASGIYLPVVSDLDKLFICPILS